MRYFTERPKALSSRDCDVTVEKPTFIMKIDAGAT
jgi:hypothetical protein